MRRNSDFLIEGWVLKKYVGPGGTVMIPAGVKVIGDGAFRGCGGLAEVTIPEGVTTIGEWAFDGCGEIRIFAGKEGCAAAYAEKYGLSFSAV